MPGKHNGLTVLDFLDEMKEELETLFENVKLNNPRGELVSPSVYKHDLPVPQTDDDTELSYMPYVIVRANTGKIKDWDSSDQAKELTVLLLVGVYNANPQRTGSLDVLSLLQRIENHLGTTRRVGNFTVGSDFQWVLAEADTHPYYFGGATLSFECPRVIKEDPLI